MFPTRSGGSLNDDINAIYASMFQQPHHYDHHYDHHFGRSLLSADPREDGLARGPESWKYGVGGYQPPTKIGYNLTDAVVVATDWVGFLALGGAAAVLIYKLFTFKGPDGEEYYVGYREEKCLSIYVNLIAALTYWGRICAHFNGDIGLSLTVNFYKYFDYIFTCPVLTLDLLWSLNLPYKFTYAIFVLLIMVTGVFCNAFEPPARYLWFAFSWLLFVFTFYNIIRMVYCRFQQFMNDDAKKIRAPLKLSLALYFSIWSLYPALWILDEWGLLPGIAVHVLSMLMDVAAKSVYGFALLKFQLNVDKQEFDFSPLVTAKLKRETLEMPPQIKSSRSRNSRTYDDDSEPDRDEWRRDSRRRDHDDFGLNDRPDKDQDIAKTMSQIADLNKQLATLTGPGGR